EQYDWVAEEVRDAGGEATVCTGRPGSLADERRLASKMAAAAAEEYRGVIAAVVEAARDPSDGARRRAVNRLEREVQRISRRDFFPPAEREEAHQAVRRLAASVGAVAT